MDSVCTVTSERCFMGTPLKVAVDMMAQLDRGLLVERVVARAIAKMSRSVAKGSRRMQREQGG